MELNILFLGDIVGSAGKFVFQSHIKDIREKYEIDAVIVNAENIADGRGVNLKSMHFLKHHGVNMVTSGNHIWQKKDIYQYLSEQKDLLRPANFPSGCPGTGIGLFDCKGFTIGVINVQGRVFMKENLICPLKTIETALTFLHSRTNIVLVDIHAEATSEKTATAMHFDGKVTAVFGTHTHVQTADERVLPNGTAFITDAGMCGSFNSVIGVKKEAIIYQLLTQMPIRFDLQDEGPYILCGAIVKVDTETGLAKSIERIKIVDDRKMISENQE